MLNGLQPLPARELLVAHHLDRNAAPPTSAWLDRYLHRLAATDLVVIAIAVVLARIIRFGTDPATLESSLRPSSYTLVSCVLGAAWFVVLTVFRSRGPRVVGTGTEEYKRVVHASLALFGTVAIVAFLLKLEVARGYLILALPLGVLGLVLSRWRWRRWLGAQRRLGRCFSTVLVVGAEQAAVGMARTFEREPQAGYRVVGVCVPGWSAAQGGVVDLDGHHVPVLGDEAQVLDAVRSTGASTLAVSNTEFLGVEGMRSLAWRLEASHVNLMVCPGVMDVAGPRLQIRPVAGLPLLHVDKPQYRGATRASKLLVDVGVAATALLVAAPVMVVLAVLVKLTSPGPVLYRSERIGLNGEPFGMLKFRSMEVGADTRRAELVTSNEGSGPLFKLRDDPRVTRVGRWMRKFSLDELPQLLNVLRGEMSVVGPRPPLRSEVMTYTGEVHRRLLVKPGITGLWQVSGRSDLSWEESVRLDLYYVENWSIVQDLVIALRTVKVVLGSSGAY